jgi:hypothetical protein
MKWRACYNHWLLHKSKGLLIQRSVKLGMLMVFVDATTKKRRTTSWWCASMMILDVQLSSYFDCFISFIIIILILFQFLTIILNYCCLDLLLKEKSFKFLVIIILNLFFSIDHWIGAPILKIKELKHTIQRFHNIDFMDMKRHIDENWHLPSPHKWWF